ncbi:MAG: DNA-primase RepB domain-containing protein, partial [Glaciecola sp.]
MNQAKKSNTTTAIPLSSDSTSFNSFCSSLSGLQQTYEWRAISRKYPKSFTGMPDEIFDSLEAANQAGYDIFITVNETDGVDVKQANITRVRALFADFDGSPLSNLDRIPLKPSFTVNTSPGKHHAYWLIDGCPLDEFKPMQQKLAHILDSDPAVCDLGRIMRVPGFYHLKGDPFMVTIDCPEQLNRYSFADMKNALSSLAPINDVTARYSLKVGCTEGSRNTALTSLAGGLIHDCLSDAAAIQALMDWNTRNTPPLPD